jgi:hypothetical protein
LHHRDWSSGYTAYGNIGNQENLVIVLAGYKENLWPTTLNRIRKYLPTSFDVCVVSAGKSHEAIKKHCLNNNWCYVSVKKNKTGTALNIAIDLHKNANWIYKLDEDIFVVDDFFIKLKNGFKSIVETGDFIPGFCAPIINVNGVSYRYFLDSMNLTAQYVSIFNEKTISCGDVHAHYNPESALWLWRHSLPFDKVSDFFGKLPASYIPIPTRFSIGAILFERTFWLKINGFKSAWEEGKLGIDEEFFCKDCINYSRPMFLISNVFAGHFSFGPQEQKMLASIPALKAIDDTIFP